MKQLWAILFLLIIKDNICSQSCSNLNLQLQANVPSPCAKMTMGARQDLLGRPYLYVAQKEAGLSIYDISTLTAPVLVKNIPISFLDSLHVMNLQQDGNYLYLALGNSFNTGQNPGMAIVDISIPTTASVTNVWKSVFTTGGSGIVKVENNYAYLGGMYHGLMILDVTNKNNIVYVSRYVPDRNYPTTVNPASDTTHYNARGLEVINSIVYLCYDKGGFRVINCTNKNNPVETGRYCNPALNSLQRAYNNIVLKDTLAYIAVDYCGMEILNIKDTAHITLLSWWNPWHCQSNPFNWFSSNGHTNEIEYNTSCKLIFLSSGKSDMRVVDVSNPLLPDSCNFYGNITDTLGTWGLSMSGNNIFLSYICTAGVPFNSNWTGVKILTYNGCNAADIERITKNNEVKIYPVPAGNYFVVEPSLTTKQLMQLYDVNGKLILNKNIEGKIIIDASTLNEGFYNLSLISNVGVVNKKLVIVK